MNFQRPSCLACDETSHSLIGWGQTMLRMRRCVSRLATEICQLSCAWISVEPSNIPVYRVRLVSSKDLNPDFGFTSVYTLEFEGGISVKEDTMSSSSKRKEESHLLNGGVKQSTWSKAFNSKAVWEEKVSRWFCFKSGL